MSFELKINGWGVRWNILRNLCVIVAPSYNYCVAAAHQASASVPYSQNKNYISHDACDEEDLFDVSVLFIANVKRKQTKGGDAKAQQQLFSCL